MSNKVAIQNAEELQEKFEKWFKRTVEWSSDGKRPSDNNKEDLFLWLAAKAGFKAGYQTGKRAKK